MINKESRKRIASIVPCVTSSGASENANDTLYLIDVMSDSQVSETFDMICSASKLGQGYGVGEYSNEDEFRAEIANGYRFAVMEKHGGKMVAAFILAVSKYSRGCHVADPFIIVRQDCRRRGLGRLCLELCVKFAACLDFQGMYVDTFSNNIPMIRIIESIPGFQQVGCLPMGGVMTDGEVVGTLIYYKDLRP